MLTLKNKVILVIIIFSYYLTVDFFQNEIGQLLLPVKFQ